MAVIAEFEIAVREAAQADGQPTEPDQFGFAGQLFDIVEDVSTLPMMRYAAALLTNDTTTIYAAAYNLLRALVEPNDWGRFEATATTRKATYKQLMDGVVYPVYNHVIGRPTRQPSGSSDGLPATGDASKPDSSSPPTQRPDLAVPMVEIDDL